MCDSDAFGRQLLYVALCTLVLAHTERAYAEGSDEFDIRDSTYGGTADDQSLEPDTIFYVDVANGGNEQICFNGTGTLSIYRPVSGGPSPSHTAASTTLLTTLTNNNCTAANLLDGNTGAYLLTVSAQQSGNWDIRVCSDAVLGSDCRTVNSNEVLGRLWAYRWHFDTGSFLQPFGANGSVYAVVPGGGVDKNAVIEMRMDSVAGRDYLLFANSIGPETTADVRVGRSVPSAGHKVNPEFRLYLSPPEQAIYEWVEPEVQNPVQTATCGDGVVLSTAPGSITFTSNVTGQYVLICDLNGTLETGDGIFDFASATDFSAFGTAVIGPNTVQWNGTDNSSANVDPGTYDCIIRLNVGEFHYVAQDIETSFPGFRMYRLEIDRTTRTPIPMFWDDRSAPAADGNMPNGQASPTAPPPNGMDPQSTAIAAAAFHYSGMTPTGNARAWGDFNDGSNFGTGDGKGNNAFLDTFAAADTAISDVIEVSVIGAAGDEDGDTLSNSAECGIGTHPQDPDTDGDGVRDDDDEVPLDENLCRDADDDDCDDCAITGGDGSGGDTENDGDDNDDDELCDLGDEDDDNDGVPDGDDDNPTEGTICDDSDGDGCDDCSAGNGPAPANDGPDFDGDSECDLGDPDDDNDGIRDDVELGGTDLSLDDDGDGVQDFQDPDEVSCDDLVPPAGVCDALPAAVDADGDGQPNQADRDTDGDGLTDAREAGGDDDDGGGVLDGCPPVNALGACTIGLFTSLPNTDGPADALADVLDLDSDGDGIGDTIEAFDLNGDGSSDVLANATDSDGDGIDDAYDPDCDIFGVNCGPIVGSPVVEPLAAPRDADGNGTPDWLQLCGDAYTGGGEACDDANGVDGDACNNACRDGLGQPCTLGTECASTLCDSALDTCQSCIDDQPSATDSGCGPAAPACATEEGSTNVCRICSDDAAGSGTDDGCSAATPMCDEAAGGGLGACGECEVGTDCDDSNDCTTDTCTTGTCSNPSLGEGASCGGGTGVCDANATPACVTCIDDEPTGAVDSGCSAGTPACDPSAGGGDGQCVACMAHGDCASGVCGGSQTCVTCLDTAAGTATDLGCGGATPLCDSAAAGGAGVCVACFDDQTGDATDVGCGGAARVCNPSTDSCVTCLDAAGNDDIGCSGATALCNTAASGGLGACVACLGNADCDDANECTTNTCTLGACSHPSIGAGASCGGGAGVCDESAAPACVTCIDDEPAGTTDSGCASGAPLCDESGPTPECVECFVLGDCALGEFCTAQNTCAAGCGSDLDCAGFPLTPLCDESATTCVQCIADGDCPGIQVCLGDHTCSAPDGDEDGVSNEEDADDDNDGIADAAELDGSDLSVDGDSDGIPDYRDPDAVTCADTAPADGDCDALPTELDPDADGVPSHLDRDSDGDGLTDANEAGGVDADGDGEPDGCAPVDADGSCASGLVTAPPNTDAPADTAPDFLDLDSDGDGVDDHVEAFDADGNGDSDQAPSEVDGDGDGIDDAFDPDCAAAADCSGVIGEPVLSVLTSAQDSDGDATPDWLQLCGDAYVTSGEACDDANGVDGDACNNACLRGLGEDCDGDGDCVSTHCDAGLGTCQGCVDGAASGTDPGCPPATPTCTVVAGANACVVCADDQTGVTADDGCSGATALCDAAAAGGLGACVECLSASDCDDDDECTGDTCSAGVCGSPPLAAGMACSGGVCDGASTPACVPCIDDAASGATDSGCSGATPTCDTSGASAVCRGCLADGDCGGGVCASNACATCEDDQTGATADHGCSAPAPFCAGSGSALACVECVVSADCDGGYCAANTCLPGCAEDRDCDDTPETPVCATASHECVECLTDAQCPGQQQCSAASSCEFTDSDGDGLPDDDDRDDDGDGIADADELGGTDRSGDEDDDGIPDYLDEDSVACGETAAGVCDSVPDELDLDEDGTPNHLDLDADGDGVPDATEGHDEDLDGEPEREPAGADADGDGLDDAFDADCDSAAACGGVIGVAAPRPDSDADDAPNFLDTDDDGDGRATLTEREDAAEYDGPADEPGDVDDDGARNWYDIDSDGDAALDVSENMGGGDVDENDLLDYLDPLFRAGDRDGDGVLDVIECPPPQNRDEGECADTDGDGTPDYDDTDDDNDGVLTADELNPAEGPDVDGDDRPNYLDPDDDDDGVPTRDERRDGDDLDTDDDGRPNRFDPDDDGDGIPTEDERTDDGEDRDSDEDGAPDHLDADDDGDGVPTEDERPDGDDVDTDDDGRPNHLDTDDDGDGLPTDVEFDDGDEFGNDVDDDGVPNHLDLDSDGDGMPDEEEGEIDEDDDGVPDYLEPGGIGGFAGGALCSASGGTRSDGGADLIGLGLIALCALRLRRRLTRSDRTGR